MRISIAEFSLCSVLGILPLILLLRASDSRVRGAPEGLNPGPDVVVGNISGLAFFGSNGPQLGLSADTSVCNAGNVAVDFIVLPSTDHPIIASNLYRMSGGSSNDERFEQIGQSWVKHAFAAAAGDQCAFGCSPGDDTHLGAGCSDVYDANQNASQNGLGSRAWVNPFTGIFPSNSNDHTGHVHTGTSHRILVESDDVNPSANSGASYYAEVQYITPNEYSWCQVHPGECNMYNNASYRRYNIAPGFIFNPAEPTVRVAPALTAWTGATINQVEPEPGGDGRAFIAYKVTGPSAGVWHYEYALYNQNLDRGIQSFTVPLGGSITVSHLGFHAPPNHPGFSNDGTLGNAGYSNAAWSATQTASALTWSSETFAQNQNANAIRWGTLYSFRFDSNRPPTATNAMIGFFKTGTPITVGIVGPDSSNATPTPTGTPGATATPSPTPGPTPTPSGIVANLVNISTRVLVQTGNNVGIGGFIIPTRADGHPIIRWVTIRALGPSLTLFGVANPLADPVLEVSGSGIFNTLRNDNWRDDPSAVDLESNGLAPSNDLESAMSVLLPSGSYTAIVRGKDNTQGVALVEIYASLPNLSTRGFVGTGDSVMIAGMIVCCEIGEDKIVVRGLGPGLSLAGVPDALEDPTLELRNSNGALVATNNDWRDDPAQAAELIASGLAQLLEPTESALIMNLTPGAYTALLAGRNNGTGVGLVEVYQLDHQFVTAPTGR